VAGPDRYDLAMALRTTRGQGDMLGAIPFHAFLFAAYPVLFLFSNNLGEVDLGQVLPPLAVVLAAAAVVLGLVRFLGRDVRRWAIAVSATATVIFGYGHAYSVAVARGLPVVVFELAWLCAFIVALAIAVRAGARLSSLTSALNVVSLVLVVFVLVAIVPYEVRAAASDQRQQSGPAPVATGLKTTRDIYYIVLDRYGSARSLRTQYGAKGPGLFGWLTDHGFAVAPDSHANYVKTSLSLAATLDMEYLDDIATQMGPDSSDHQPVFDILKDHAVGRFLKDQGYRYIHIGSYYGPTQSARIADVNLRYGTSSDFVAALYDKSIAPRIARLIGLTHAEPARERHASVARFQFDTLASVATKPGPKFVFAHVLLPHPPYVFAPDGRFTTDEEAAATTQKQGFLDQLAYTDRRVEALIAPLVAQPEATRPIIILQADEGPYPPRYSRDTVTFDWATATPTELEVKYGILNAMLLPGVDPGAVYPTISSVNTFRLVFDRYFGADLPLLPDRSFTSRGKLRPYDLTDITDRLPSLH
jgi:hypothetical protein